MVVLETSGIKGRILLIQEDRFRLVGEKGQEFLFTLSHKASCTADDLELWHKENRPVLVEYEGEPDFESAVAHSVRPADENRVDAPL